MIKTFFKKGLVSFFLLISLISLKTEVFATAGGEVEWQQAHEVAHAPIKKATATLAEQKTSEIFAVLEQTCEMYAQTVFNELSPPILKLFLMIASILVLWKIGIEGVLRKNIDPLGLFRLFFLISILSAFINSHDLYWKFFYNPIKEATMDMTMIVTSKTSGAASWQLPDQAAQNQVRQTSGSASGGEVRRLLDHVDEQFATIIDHAFKLVNSSYTDMGSILIGLVLLFIYKLISILFLFYVADLFFGLMLISAMGPLFLAMFLLPMTKGYSEGAIRMTIGSCLTVIFSGLAIGICLTLTNNAVHHYDVAIAGAQFSGWKFLCVGFLSLLFMRRAPQMAASITGSADSGSSSLMIGAAMTAASMGKMGMMMAGGKLLGAAKAAYASRGGNKFEPIPMFKDGPAKD